jgi:DNA polymerase-1
MQTHTPFTTSDDRLAVDSPQPKELLIIDGFNLLYRAYYANRDLATPTGQATGAVHGFFRSLHMLEKNHPHAQVAITWDRIPDGTWAEIEGNIRLEKIESGRPSPAPDQSRKSISPMYKAHRTEMPQELQSQLAYILMIADGYGLPMFQGTAIYEADDLLGSLAHQAQARGVPVTIGTGDKDILAMVKDTQPACQVFSFNTNTYMREKDVLEKFGVKPHEIPDFLALMGDSVDGIEGVKGCGPKTAAKWIAQYQGVEGIVANAHEIKGVVGNHLREAANRLGTNKTLATLRTNIDAPLFDQTRAKALNIAMVVQLCDHLALRQEKEHALKLLQQQEQGNSYEPS